VRKFKAFIAIVLSAAVCSAQNINIGGTVKNTAGVGISDAVVRLINAGITTKTSTDGSFTLTNGPADIHKQLFTDMAGNNAPFIMNNKLNITISHSSSVKIADYNLQGRIIACRIITLGVGSHSIALPSIGACLFLCRINIDNSEYILKRAVSGQVNGLEYSFTSNKTGNNNGLSKQAESSVAIDDVIEVTKGICEYLKYSMTVTNSDTSGIEIKMLPCADTVRDADGNLYQAVRIGNQVWTVENLRTTTFNDSTAIPHVIGWEWEDIVNTPAYCFYQNTTDPEEIEKWGALYNWYAVNSGKLAPAGWHVPAKSDWAALDTYLIVNGYNWDGTTTGNKIGKALAAVTDWKSSDIAGAIGNNIADNNSTGFSVLPGGFRWSDGMFYGRMGIAGPDRGFVCYLWSASEGNAGSGWDWEMYFGASETNMNSPSKKDGLNVRLVRE
jgi:uncharacterized protein (TIGR02145 family)